MCDIGSKVSANDAMPGWVEFFVELLLDVGGNVLLNVVLLQCLEKYNFVRLLNNKIMTIVPDYGIPTFAQTQLM